MDNVWISRISNGYIKCTVFNKCNAECHESSTSFKILLHELKIFSHCYLYDLNQRKLHIPLQTPFWWVLLTASFDCGHFILKCIVYIPEIYTYKVLMLEYTWLPYFQNTYETLSAEFGVKAKISQHKVHLLTFSRVFNCISVTPGWVVKDQHVVSLFLLILLELLNCVLLPTLFIDPLSLLSVRAVLLVIALPDSISLLALFSVSALSRRYS